jgi:hypothetical protein
LLSALPYVFFWLFQVGSGLISDCLIEKKKSRSNSEEKARYSVRRIFNGIGFFVPMCTMIGLIFVTCEYKAVGVTLVCMGIACL